MTDSTGPRPGTPADKTMIHEMLRPQREARRRTAAAPAEALADEEQAIRLEAQLTRDCGRCNGRDVVEGLGGEMPCPQCYWRRRAKRLATELAHARAELRPLVKQHAEVEVLVRAAHPAGRRLAQCDLLHRTGGVLMADVTPTGPCPDEPPFRYLAEVAHLKAHEIAGRVPCPTDDLDWWEQIVAAVLAVGAPRV